jgi:CRP-like cAMP-binding protein
MTFMQRGSTSDSAVRQLVLKTHEVLDIPAGTRTALIVVGAIGVILAVVASLDGGQEHTLAVDTILHLLGYAALATVFVLALRPRFFIPALLLLVALGIGIEFLQPLNGRSFQGSDMVANTIGVAIGAAIGLMARLILGRIRASVAAAEFRRNLRRFEAGEVIVAEGEQIRDFYIIKNGAVEVTHRTDQGELVLGTLGPGDAVGVVSVILGLPQLKSVSAISPSYLYRMDLDQLMTSAGGPDQPASVVLRSLADSLKVLADDVVAARLGPANQ